MSHPRTARAPEGMLPEGGPQERPQQRLRRPPWATGRLELGAPDEEVPLEEGLHGVRNTMVFMTQESESSPVWKL